MEERQIFRLPGVSVSSMDAKKRMIRRSPFVSFEPSGQLKQSGTFQPSLPTVLQWLHTQSSRCHLQIPGVIPAVGSRGSLLCRYSGAPAGPSSARGNAEITKGFCLPPLSQPMLRGSSKARTLCQELASSPSSPPSFPPPVPALRRRLRRRLCLSREPHAPRCPSLLLILSPLPVLPPAGREAAAPVTLQWKSLTPQYLLDDGQHGSGVLKNDVTGLL